MLMTTEAYHVILEPNLFLSKDLVLSPHPYDGGPHPII